MVAEICKRYIRWTWTGIGWFVDALMNKHISPVWSRIKRHDDPDVIQGYHKYDEN